MSDTATMATSSFCECPPPVVGPGKRTAFEFGRGWKVSEDWNTWTCTVCGKSAPPTHVAALAGELAGSVSACLDIYAGRKREDE